jgi:hypothetical protein
LLEILIAAAFGAFQAPECLVSFERHEEARLVLRMRPACTLGFSSTRTAVRALLAQESEARELTISFGRIERYGWLSALLARQASSSRRWDLAAGKPTDGHENAYVAAALRGMPEFTALFEHWLVTGISIEKVLVRPAAELSLPAGAPVPPSSKLPYDAIAWVTLKRP